MGNVCVRTVRMGPAVGFQAAGADDRRRAGGDYCAIVRAACHHWGTVLRQTLVLTPSQRCCGQHRRCGRSRRRVVWRGCDMDRSGARPTLALEEQSRCLPYAGRWQPGAVDPPRREAYRAKSCFSARSRPPPRQGLPEDRKRCPSTPSAPRQSLALQRLPGRHRSRPRLLRRGCRNTQPRKHLPAKRRFRKPSPTTRIGHSRQPIKLGLR
jgi:hypothetical protein